MLTSIPLQFARSYRLTQTHPTIPSVDFSAFLRGSAGDRLQIASAIDGALSSVGFIRLHNHGIEQQKIDACFQWSKRLFAFSKSEKLAIYPSSRSHNRGYSSVGNEKVRDRICMKENFDCGNPKDNERRNSWPTEVTLPGFRHFTEDFFQACAKLVHQLLECLSLALNLSAEDSLSQYHASSLFDLSLIHYPAVPVGRLSSGRFVRNPAHSDFGTLTLLFQDEVGGLEIADINSTSNGTSATVDKSGSFIHIDPIPETIIVNVGYLLMRWSNGRWKNTVHRVSEPPPWRDQGLQGSNLDDTSERGGGSVKEIPQRYSVAYFSSPDPATVIKALACCYNDQVPKKPIIAGEYLRKKRAAMYTYDM